MPPAHPSRSPFHFIRAFDHFFYARRVDTAVYDKLLQRDTGDFS